MLCGIQGSKSKVQGCPPPYVGGYGTDRETKTNWYYAFMAFWRDAQKNARRGCHNGHSSLEQPINVRGSSEIEGADGAHLLEDANQGLLEGAGAGLGFRDDLPEFGFNEVLPREDLRVFFRVVTRWMAAATLSCQVIV